jgi:hypothetical protein
MSYPRIPVTASMLFTYAHMKGKELPFQDPLHRELYPHIRRRIQENRIQVPYIWIQESLEEYV